MNFKKRLLYYLSGFSLGLIIVFSILGVRGCEWLPKTRIVTAINSTQLLVSKANLENIKCNTASDAIFSLINNGEIHIDNGVDTINCTYIQLENRKVMNAKELINGLKIHENSHVY